MAYEIVHILGCGETGKYFPGHGQGEYVIGVNDSWKFGKVLGSLLFLNRPRHFAGPRLEIIKSTQCSKVVCMSHLVPEWSEYFPAVEALPNIERWRKLSYKPGTIYHTNTSPFTAMSYALEIMRAKSIVLWGVDFINHNVLNAVDCVPAFSEFQQAAKIPIFKGHKDSRLNLPIFLPQ